MSIYFWALILLTSVSIFMPIQYSFGYCDFALTFEIRKFESPKFVTLSQDCFGCLGSLEGPCEF